MDRRRRSSGLKLVAPPGSLASAPVASKYWNQGRIGPLFLNTSNSQLYVSVRSYHNEGADYGDWGNITAVRLATLPTLAYKIRVVIKAKTSGFAGQILSFSGGTGFVQWGVLQLNSQFNVQSGSSINSSVVETLDFCEVINESNGTNHRAIVNGVEGPFVANGTETYNGKIFIGGRTDGATANWEGETFLAEIKNASNECIACFNANSPAQWDGGATATDSAGNPIAFTDAIPLGRAAYSWIKLSDALAWGIIV